MTFPDQPDNWKGYVSHGEDCLTMRVGSGQLNDVHCTYQPEGYICEIQATGTC